MNTQPRIAIIVLSSGIFTDWEKTHCPPFYFLCDPNGCGLVVRARPTGASATS